MTWLSGTRWTRGGLLRAVIVAPVAFVVAACTREKDAGGTSAEGQRAADGAAPAGTARSTGSESPRPAGSVVTQALPATLECGDDDDDPTPAQTEGPYFTPNSPERTSLLEAGMAGRRLGVAGFVLSTDCQPVAGALVDFWQCDDAGEYDNAGYRLRGHQFTDSAGRYTLETIVPGLYPGRTRHIHVKVQAPNRRVLTTQLYFPGEAQNARDGIFRRELLIDVQDGANESTGSFNFVLNL